MADDTKELVKQAREAVAVPRETTSLTVRHLNLLAGLANAVEQLQRERDEAREHWRGAVGEANRLLPLLDAANHRALNHQEKADEARARVADLEAEIANPRRDEAMAELWAENLTERSRLHGRVAALEAGIENIAGSLHEGIAYHQVRGALFALRWVRPPGDVTEDDLERGREVAAALLDSEESQPPVYAEMSLEELIEHAGQKLGDKFKERLQESIDDEVSRAVYETESGEDL